MLSQHPTQESLVSASNEDVAMEEEPEQEEEEDEGENLENLSNNDDLGEFLSC